MNQPAGVQRLEKAIEGMIEEIQRVHLLPRQKEAFLCCARCCDSPGSIQALEGCIQSCSMPSAQAQRSIQGQLGEFQDSMPYDPSPSDQAKGQERFNGCMDQAGKEFIDKLPKLKADIMASLKKA